MSETMINHRNLPTPMHGPSAAVRVASFPVLTGERRRPTLARLGGHGVMKLGDPSP